MHKNNCFSLNLEYFFEIGDFFGERLVLEVWVESVDTCWGVRGDKEVEGKEVEEREVEDNEVEDKEVEDKEEKVDLVGESVIGISLVGVKGFLKGDKGEMSIFKSGDGIVLFGREECIGFSSSELSKMISL